MSFNQWQRRKANENWLSRWQASGSRLTAGWIYNFRPLHHFSVLNVSTSSLYELTAKLEEQELAVFFRNNHFSTLYKRSGELFLLVTDLGFLSQVFQSRLVNFSIQSTQSSGMRWQAIIDLPKSLFHNLDYLLNSHTQTVTIHTYQIWLGLAFYVPREMDHTQTIRTQMGCRQWIRQQCKAS